MVLSQFTPASGISDTDSLAMKTHSSYTQLFTLRVHTCPPRKTLEAISGTSPTPTSSPTLYTARTLERKCGIIAMVLIQPARVVVQI